MTFALAGNQNCGKTTLLNLILGVTDTDEGTIYYQEEDITKLSMEKRDFNIVFQDYALFPNLNVYQNIVYGLRNKPGLSTAEEVCLDRSVGTACTSGQKNRAVVRWAETARCASENDGDETKDLIVG